MERCLWPRMTSWCSPSVHAHHIRLLSCNLHRKSGYSQSLRLADTAISAFATTFSAANSSSKVDQKFFPCICSTSWYTQEPSSAHQFSFYSIFHAFRPFFREVFTVWTRCQELVLKPLCRWAPRRAIWQSLKGYYKITVALRPSYKGDIYCKWYVIMFGLWLFECFTPPLNIYDVCWPGRESCIQVLSKLHDMP